MRKNIRLVALCAAALTLASCAKEIATPDPVEKEASLFNMTVYAGDDTKTEIESDGAGGYKVNWLSGDMLGVYEVGNGVVQDKTVSSPLTAGGSTAAFEFAFAGAPAAPYDYTFVYPASALGKVGENYLVTLPGTQTFAEGSFDMDADVLVSEHVQSDVRPTSTDVRFARLGATVKMTVNAPVTTENIRKIVFSTTEANIVGSYVLNPQTGALADDMVSGSKAITLTPETATVYSGNIVVWFRVAEVTLSQNFTVSVTTDAKTYTKTINLAAKERQLPFRDGKMAMVGIDLTDVSGVENTRVDVIDLAYTGVSGTTYTAWEKKGSKSEAEYKGKTNETSGVMGLRTTNSDCGIVTTVSGGKVKQVTITLKPTGYKRTIDVYAKNTAYSDVSDLYSDSKLIQGNKIGSVSVAAAATENVTETVVFTSDYNFVGIRSYNSAAAVPEIRISWEGTPVPSVSTGEATDIHANGATLSGSYAGASGGIYEAGFYWDTDASDLEDIAHKEQKITVDGSALTSGNFSGEIGSLDEVTTYYFRAYVLWLDVEENTYKEFLGPILEFTTHAKAYVPGGWLEMPAYTVDGMNGTTTSSLGDLYPLTHYATMNDKQQRNYSLLYDPEMYASYWVAYPLCSSHLGTGRSSNPFDYDPDVPSEKERKTRV